MNAPILTIERPTETTERPRRGRHRRPSRLRLGRVLGALRGTADKH
ncbi:hypothetical protein Afil01_31120 [Actinorhabdospora filicis]|uniref:Uncharacterized protein n=1 Tax=Actinorhabdospora filicis TaxID=1785913 RepID=A0A9W6WB37_9ACTN|nr:hypothetical protein [Actinorhabdospora filicis]GLZ78305.1 hypothetical protein Afil01_31120 [Actinorhabdospora filicis]